MRRRLSRFARTLTDAELVEAVTEAGLDGAPRDGRRSELEVFLAERGCTPLDWIRARAALKGIVCGAEVTQ